METAGEFVSPLAEFATGVQVGQHELDGRHTEFRVHVYRYASTVVLHRDGTIRMDRDRDNVTEAGEVFVDRVIEHLENGVVKTSFGGGIADIHSRTLADRLEALQLVNLSGIIFSGWLRGLVDFSSV